MSEEPSKISTPTQEDPSEVPPPPYGPPQPEYLPAELADPPPQVRYSPPAGDQTVRLQDIRSIDVVDRSAPRITRQESDNWRIELRNCCLAWFSACDNVCKKYLLATISILITPAQIVSQNPAVGGKRSKFRTLTLVFLDRKSKHERHLKEAESPRQSCPQSPRAF